MSVTGQRAGGDSTLECQKPAPDQRAGADPCEQGTSSCPRKPKTSSALMKLECQSCRSVQDRSFYYCQQPEDPRSTWGAKRGLHLMATGVAKRFGFVWTFVICDFEAQAHTKTKQNLKACKRARRLNFTDSLDRYEKRVTYAWRTDANGVAFDKMAEQIIHGFSAISTGRSTRRGCTYRIVRGGATQPPHGWDYPGLPPSAISTGGTRDPRQSYASSWDSTQCLESWWGLRMVAMVRSGRARPDQIGSYSIGFLADTNAEMSSRSQP